jgi:hypothetical protein
MKRLMKFKVVNYIRLNSKMFFFRLKYCSDNIFCLLGTNDSEQNEPFCGQIFPLSAFFLPTTHFEHKLKSMRFFCSKNFSKNINEILQV